MTTDLQIVGLDPGTVSLPDIGMDVPHGIVVRIPADKASNSKDLWRAINQRRVFRLQGTVSTVVPPPAFPDETAHLRARMVALEQENQTLRTALAVKGQEVAPEQGKLDEILGLLRSGSLAIPSASATTTARVAPVVVGAGVIEVETPTFIPSTIKGDTESPRVEVAETSTESGGVSAGREALRKLRRGE